MPILNSPPSGGSAVASKRNAVTLAPASGAAVVIPTGFDESVVWLAPAGTLASISFTFPADGNSKLLDIIRIGSSKEVTTVTLTGPVILNPLDTLSINDVATYQKIAANTWVRLA